MVLTMKLNGRHYQIDTALVELHASPQSRVIDEIPQKLKGKEIIQFF